MIITEMRNSTETLKEKGEGISSQKTQYKEIDNKKDKNFNIY